MVTLTKGRGVSTDEWARTGRQTHFCQKKVKNRQNVGKGEPNHRFKGGTSNIQHPTSNTQWKGPVLTESSQKLNRGILGIRGSYEVTMGLVHPCIPRGPQFLNERFIFKFRVTNLSQDLTCRDGTQGGRRVSDANFANVRECVDRRGGITHRIRQTANGTVQSRIRL